MRKTIKFWGDKILDDGREYRTFTGEKTWSAGGSPRPVAERFFEKVDMRPGQGPEGTCWEWRGRRYARGYGYFHIKKRTCLRATHMVLNLLRGTWRKPQDCVCHHCDNPPCVRPSHLFVGTNADNVRDRERKGRNNPPKGSRNGRAKLTERQVMLIRSLYRKFGRNGSISPGETSTGRLALLLDVTKTLIRKIVNRNIWKHIP